MSPYVSCSCVPRTLGASAWSSCCATVLNPSYDPCAGRGCTHDAGSIRNLALERFAASSVVSCSHEGCSVMLPMRRVEEHEAQCAHRPLPCPAAEDGCTETFGSEGVVCEHLMVSHGASLTDLTWDAPSRSATCEPMVIPPGMPPHLALEL